MSGLDVAAGITGLIVFSLKTLQSCATTMDLITRARDFAKYADQYRGQLDWEKHRLEEWYEQIRSARDDLLSTQRQLNWTRIKDILAQLEILLTDVERLENIYHMKLDRSTADKIGEMVLVEPQKLSLLDKIKWRMRPDIKTVTAQRINEQTSNWVKGKFAISGETKIRQFVQDITALVDKLWDCLRDNDRAFLVRSMETLLRQAVVQTPTVEGMRLLDGIFHPPTASPSSREILDTVDPLKKLKETRLKLAMDLAGDERRLNDGNPIVRVPRSIRVKSGDVVAYKVLSPLRELGAYKEKRMVLIEWKEYLKKFEDKLGPRIEALGVLLAQAGDLCPGFLPFVGFFKDYGADRYAFIFELPSISDSGSCVQTDSILTQLDRFSLPPPPFHERLSIAISLTTAVRQLHTVGWLHKGIRSDNLLFWYSSGTGHTSLQGPFLADFGLARAAGLTEFSEPLTFNRDTLSTGLYAHPASLSGYGFRKSFDIYSMGLVLLEIGLWQSLEFILKDASQEWRDQTEAGIYSPTLVATLRDEIMSQSGPGSVNKRLEEGSPPYYTRVVKRILDLAQSKDLDEFENSNELQTAIVEDLESGRLQTQP